MKVGSEFNILAKRRLAFFSYMAWICVMPIAILAQNPHGENLRVNCADCHTSDSWEIPSNYWAFRGEGLVVPGATLSPTDTLPKASFTHEDTDFPLEGGHITTDCRFCHETLVFSEASSTCVSCHTDIHHMTVGDDCARCHTSENWLVDNITELHQENGFPLLGVHAQINCNECHISESGLQFTRLGNDCFTCHQEDYLATTDPNHIALGYSTACSDCHNAAGFGWGAEDILHDGLYFPIYSGNHKNEWNDCAECHIGGDYTNFSCIDCHEHSDKNDVDGEHNGVAGYRYASPACLECHPNGNE